MSSGESLGQSSRRPSQVALDALVARTAAATAGSCCENAPFSSNCLWASIERSSGPQRVAPAALEATGSPLRCCCCSTRRQAATVFSRSLTKTHPRSYVPRRRWRAFWVQSEPDRALAPDLLLLRLVLGACSSEPAYTTVPRRRLVSPTACRIVHFADRTRQMDSSRPRAAARRSRSRAHGPPRSFLAATAPGCRSSLRRSSRSRATSSKRGSSPALKLGLPCARSCARSCSSACSRSLRCHAALSSCSSLSQSAARRTSIQYSWYIAPRLLTPRPASPCPCPRPPRPPHPPQSPPPHPRSRQASRRGRRSRSGPCPCPSRRPSPGRCTRTRRWRRAKRGARARRSSS